MCYQYHAGVTICQIISVIFHISHFFAFFFLMHSKIKRNQDLAQADTQPQGSLLLFLRRQHPASVRAKLCDSPKLSETRSRPFVASQAAVPDS